MLGKGSTIWQCIWTTFRHIQLDWTASSHANTQSTGGLDPTQAKHALSPSVVAEFVQSISVYDNTLICIFPGILNHCKDQLPIVIRSSISQK